MLIYYELSERSILEHGRLFNQREIVCVADVKLRLDIIVESFNGLCYKCFCCVLGSAFEFFEVVLAFSSDREIREDNFLIHVVVGCAESFGGVVRRADSFIFVD